VTSTAADATGHSPRSPRRGRRRIARYDAADGPHDVVVSRDDAGRWQVIDSGARREIEIETLRGYDDRLGQAEALALDYAREQQAFAVGLREDPPFPSARARRVGPAEDGPARRFLGSHKP
jgi:hypothetical protein